MNVENELFIFYATHLDVGNRYRFRASDHLRLRVNHMFIRGRVSLLTVRHTYNRFLTRRQNIPENRDRKLPGWGLSAIRKYNAEFASAQVDWIRWVCVNNSNPCCLIQFKIFQGLLCYQQSSIHPSQTEQLRDDSSDCNDSGDPGDFYLLCPIFLLVFVPLRFDGFHPLVTTALWFWCRDAAFFCLAYFASLYGQSKKAEEHKEFRRLHLSKAPHGKILRAFI